MKPLLIVLLGIVVVSTSACSNKATPGHGGLAEHDLSNAPSHSMGLENALYFEQQLSSRHFDDLLLAGAKICFPASVKTAQIRQNRIAREIQGGLDGDAANDLIIQRDQLARLERRLNYVQLQGSCLTNGDKSNPQVNNQSQELNAKLSNELSADKLQTMNALLNNNNQFVPASSELNPRYIGHLAEVAGMLRAYTNYQLQIIGHADATGSDAANLELSLQRARQVERYLQIFGLNPSNIIVQGQGEQSPLFKGDAPQVRLVNRRVTIELINLDQAQR
ncbi:MAG: outer membrane protein OmpA-like peptidoglycan-associated protein [Psychromonas sp.]|jgi:outer membrane protein OmpA-like peptidoglycan-associated protein|uniref:OmpA family protein n=1 Tax=Psychromonas sp. TaxID=1884585 RepID=UPI0039E3A37B